MSDRRVLEHFMLDARCMDNKNVYDMTLLDFYRQYPDEASCEAALRSFREHHGLFAEARAWKPAQDFRPCHGRKQPVRYASCQKVQYAQNCRAYKDAGHRRF